MQNMSRQKRKNVFMHGIHKKLSFAVRNHLGKTVATAGLPTGALRSDTTVNNNKKDF